MNKTGKDALRQLTKENRGILRKMKNYLESCYLNEVVFEDTMSDLVGMALECQKRGEPFAAAIGMDYRDFCRELAKNAQKQSWPERILDILYWLLWCGLFLVPALYGISVSRIFESAHGERFILTAPVVFLLKYALVASVIIVGWFLIRHFTYSSQTAVFSIYFAAIMASYLLMDFVALRYFGQYIVRIRLDVWIIVFILLLALCAVAKRLIAMTIAYRNRKKHDA